MGFKFIRENKNFVLAAAALLMCLAIAKTTYIFYGHQFIQSIYEGRSIELFNSIFAGRQSMPLEYYINKADSWFNEIVVLSLIFFIFLTIFYLILRISKVNIANPSPVEWFYLFAGLFFTQWYFFFLDDAFIFFRYVDNFLFLDAGLVYNKGEFVEGYSSPVWAMLLIPFRAVGLSYWVICRLVAGVCFTLFWFMMVQLNGKLSPASGSINFPLAYLSFNYGVLTYFSSGLESPLLQLVTPAYALYILNPSSLMLQILLAVSPLIRHELALPFVLAALWAWLYHKKFPLRMIVMTTVIVGSWVAFRIYYYADLFPNTYYLKDVVDIRQGLVYVQETLSTYHFYAVTAIFTVFIVLLRKKRVDLQLQKRLMMLIFAVVSTLYVIKIGGDQVHYKYLIFPFIIAICALSGILEHLIDVFRLNKYRAFSPIAGILIAMVAFSFYPPQLDRHPVYINVEVTPTNKIYEAAKHRQRPGSHYYEWKDTITIDMMREYKDNNEEFLYSDVERAYGCFNSYVRFYKRIVHGLGLTEAILARTEMKIDTPAHKLGLFPLSDDLVRIYEEADFVGRGMFREAIEKDKAPEWIRKNIDTIEIIERKIYNNHDFMENLGLAFTFPEKIIP